LSSCRLPVLVAFLAGAKGAASPRMRGAAPRTAGQALAAYRTKPHTRHRALRRACERGACTGSVERGERPACTAGRGDRRTATGLRRTTNEAFPARYLAGVRSAQRWRKTEALSPRATARVRRSVLRAVVHGLFVRRGTTRIRQFANNFPVQYRNYILRGKVNAEQNKKQITLVHV